MKIMQNSIQDEQTTEAIKQYIYEQFLYDRPEVVLTNDIQLIEQRIIDSLQIIQLINFLQDNFGIMIELEDLRLENFFSLDTITKLVSKQKETTNE